MCMYLGIEYTSHSRVECSKLFIELKPTNAPQNVSNFRQVEHACMYIHGSIRTFVMYAYRSSHTNTDTHTYMHTHTHMYAI